MTVIELLSQIEKNNIDPIYFLHGEERFLIDRALELLQKKIVQGPMKDFNLSKLKARQTTGASIELEAKGVPMMADRKLIIVEDADKLKAQDWETLESYLALPVKETCLVFVSTKFDLRRGAVSKANRRKQVHKAEPLKEKEILSFIKSRAKTKKVKIEPAAAGAISAFIGTNCAALDDAIERVSLFAGRGQVVNESHVNAVVSNIRQHTVFELVDAIGSKRSDVALKLLTGLLANRQEPLLINALLARHVRQLLTARILTHQRASEKEIASALGVPFFVVKKIVSQSKQFSGAKLESQLLLLAQTDRALKSSRKPGSLVLEETVMELCLGS